MRKIAFLLVFMLILGACAPTTGIPSDGETLDGSYICDVYLIGYTFEPDGFGLQFIGDQHYMIKYCIKDDLIYIENFSVEGGNIAALSFANYGDYITIDGLKFVKQP